MRSRSHRSICSWSLAGSRTFPSITWTNMTDPLLVRVVAPSTVRPFGRGVNRCRGPVAEVDGKLQRRNPPQGRPQAVDNLPGHSTGVMRVISSWQWRGGSGSASGATVMRTSAPQISHR